MGDTVFVQEIINADLISKTYNLALNVKNDNT